MKIVKNSEVRLVINLRLQKNVEENYAEQKIQNERIQIHQSLIARFSFSIFG